MNSVEDRLLAAMSAAAELAATEIPAAPPLHLPPEPALGARRGRGRMPRHWSRWTIPLTSAAAVVVLAIALVLIKDIPNGSVVPPNPGTSAGPGGVPRYYVALKQVVTYTDVVIPPAGIVVGDSLTGGTLATFAPPARTTFASVTAAADDRTFVVFAVTSATGSFAAKARTTLTGRWYQVRLAPGAARPARLTRLPIKPVTLLRDLPADAGQAALYGTFATALSGSGRELAVPEWVAPHGLAVKVFSVATGRLLHEWTTSDPSLALVPPSLTWIDGDRSLALFTGNSYAAGGPVAADFSVREWPVAGSPSGDLAAVSKVVWSLQDKGNTQTTLQNCVAPLGYIHISADGKTFSCVTAAQGLNGAVLRFYTFPLAASTTATAKGRLDASLRLRASQGGSEFLPQVLWASPSGGTLIGAWITAVGVAVSSGAASSAAAAPGQSIGVISQGRFAPLRLPPGLNLSAAAASIAW